jgi:hypothetical protein
MRKVLPYLLGLLALGCKTEMDVDIANEQTFIRYFGSESSHTAHLATETVDPITQTPSGYTLLSTVETATDNFGHFIYQIQLIQTDLYGNQLWQKTYPEFNEYKTPACADNAESCIPEGLVGGYAAASFIQSSDGGY